jgi:endonuclease-3
MAAPAKKPLRTPDGQDTPEEFALTAPGVPENFSFLTRDDTAVVFERFRQVNPNPISELVAPNPYTFLVSVVLSAQATDVSVNKATQALYKIADTPKKMLALGESGVSGYIQSIGLYRNKARHVIALSALIEERFGGAIPRTRADLESLPGVGRKTASVVLNAVYGEPTMPVDTHILRISPRIGLSAGKTPLAVEKDLLACIPEVFLPHAHHWLVLHGRYVCTARKPLCETCVIHDVCRHNGVING